MFDSVLALDLAIVFDVTDVTNSFICLMQLKLFIPNDVGDYWFRIQAIILLK